MNRRIGDGTWAEEFAVVLREVGVFLRELVQRRGVPQAARIFGAHERAPPSAALSGARDDGAERAWRSQDELPYALKRITDAGVRSFAYSTNSEIKRESAADKFMIHAIAFVDDMAREQSRERTRDALRRKAERGHVAGGMLYGYKNVRADGHVTRVIVPEEAEVITRIFSEIAAGAGYLKVA